MGEQLKIGMFSSTFPTDISLPVVFAEQRCTLGMSVADHKHLDYKPLAQASDITSLCRVCYNFKFGPSLIATGGPRISCVDKPE